MDEVFFVVQTPIFWFGTVFVGLLLSVFGAAIYDWLKIQVGKFSSKQRKRNEAEKERIEQEARKCARSVKLLVLRGSNIVECRLLIMAWVAAAILWTGFGTAIYGIPALWVMLPRLVEILPLEIDVSQTAFTSNYFAQSVTRGWQPLVWGRVLYVSGLVLSIPGFYCFYLAFRSAQREMYWRRVLYRAGQLVEEELESSTPDTDYPPHTTEPRPARPVDHTSMGLCYCWVWRLYLWKVRLV